MLENHRHRRGHVKLGGGGGSTQCTDCAKCVCALAIHTITSRRVLIAVKGYVGLDASAAGAALLISTYRIRPIQEGVERPLWTVNNGASGFVSRLRERDETEASRSRPFLFCDAIPKKNS